MSKWYLTSDELADAVKECQDNGNAPSETVCIMFRTLAQRLTGSQKYARYSVQDKEDMVSAALEKMIRNIKNFKQQYRKCAFSYFTRCAEQGFWAYLMKHYRNVNVKREAILRYAETVRRYSPDAARKIIEKYQVSEDFKEWHQGKKKARPDNKGETNRDAPET